MNVVVSQPSVARLNWPISFLQALNALNARYKNTPPSATAFADYVTRLGMLFNDTKAQGALALAAAFAPAPGTTANSQAVNFSGPNLEPFTVTLS